MHRRGRSHGAWLSGGLALGGCLFDVDERCGDNQVLKRGLCVCTEGSMLAGNACVVVPGSEPPPPMGLGSACDAVSSPCTEPAYPLCQKTRSGAQYCTSTGCASAADCEQGYQCDQTGPTPYCRRPFVGQGVMCSSSSECATLDASYCSLLLSLCLVRDCVPGGCDVGYVCIDAAALTGVPGLPWVCALEDSLTP